MLTEETRSVVLVENGIRQQLKSKLSEPFGICGCDDENSGALEPTT